MEEGKRDADVVRFQGEWSRWSCVEKEYGSSAGYPASSPTPRLLIALPDPDRHDDDLRVEELGREKKVIRGDDDDDDDEGRRRGAGELSPRGLCFFNLDEKKVIINISVLCPEVYEGRCVGSSHGWLVLLDTTTSALTLSVFNPLTGARIQLCSLEKALGFLDADEYTAYKKDCRTLIQKAVLFTTSSSSSNNLMMVDKDKAGVLLIYGGCGRKVGYCMFKDGSVFTHLGVADKHYDVFVKCFDNEYYHDAICFRNLICAVTSRGLVDVWDFISGRKVTSIECDFDRVRFTSMNSGVDPPEGPPGAMQFLNFEFYLMESCRGELLQVMRTGLAFERVDDVGKRYAVEKTWTFMVMRVELHEKKVVEMPEERWGDGDDQVMFVGGIGKSMCLMAQDCPACLKDSIYFAGGVEWKNRMAVDDGGEDYYQAIGAHVGYFNLKDKTINPLYDTPPSKILNQPFWVFLN